MTHFATFLVAVLVFAASQYLLKLVIEPVQQHRRVVGSIASYLLRNQAKITNARPDSDLSSEAHRMAAELWSSASVVFGYEFVRLLRVFSLQSRSALLKASRELNGIAAQLNPDNPQKGDAVECTRAVGRIGKLLDVPTSYEGPV